MKPVDVIIPCHDTETLVERAIRSAQQEMVSRIICVDDRSRDRTREAIYRAAERSTVPVTLLDSDAPGANGARNVGLAESQSSYCQFLDADDELMPGKIKSQVAKATAEEADIVFGSFVRRSVAGVCAVVRARSEPWRGLVTSELGCTSSCLIRRDSVMRVGGWQEDLRSSQEYDLFFRLLADGASTQVDPEPLTIKHEQPTAISHTSPVERTDQFVALRVAIRSLLEMRGELTPELNSQIDETIHRSLRRLNDDVQQHIEDLRLENLGSDFIPESPTRAARLYSEVYRWLGPRSAESIRLLLERRASEPAQ